MRLRLGRIGRRGAAATPARRPTQARHPAQVVIAAFFVAITLSTSLLTLPVATESGAAAPFVIAVFTAASAICVTGLSVVDTSSYWSTFGELVILGSVQVGGFGIMTAASLLGLLVSRRLGLRSRLLTRAETGSVALGDVREVVRAVALASLSIELAVAVALFVRFQSGYDESLGRAAYLAIFHSVNAFNHAGFALWSDGLVRFVADPWISLPIALAIILGSLGFPVLMELRRELRSPSRWSLHTKITLLGSGLLLFGGAVLITAFEWTNPHTLGPLGAPAKLLAGFFQGATPRSAGFNTVDYAQLNPTSWLTTDVLMFIGGGSASTAGGIKVTTFMILFFAIVAEARGDRTVDAFGRAIPTTVIRQAIAVALLGVAVVATASLVVLAITGEDLDRVVFEAISAFSTTGLSTGLSATMPAAAQYVLVVLMFVGRVGSVTVASALALRQRHKLYRLPEERPLVG
jgi:trk system potassium uptake protein TrkH